MHNPMDRSTRPGHAASPRRVSLGSTFEELQQPVRMMAGAGAGRVSVTLAGVRRERQDENGKMALQAWIQRWRFSCSKIGP